MAWSISALTAAASRIPDSLSYTDNSEHGTDICDDGLDNDVDGLADFRIDGFRDPGCANAFDTDERAGADLPCDDYDDADGDGFPAYRSDGAGDPGCDGPADSSELGLTACDDGMEGDCDGLIDMDDPGCTNPTDDDERYPAPLWCRDDFPGIIHSQCDDCSHNHDSDGLDDWHVDPAQREPQCVCPQDCSVWSQFPGDCAGWTPP